MSKDIDERFDAEFPSPDGQDFIGMERISSLKAFLRKELADQKAKFDLLIAKEMNIANKEGTPTSRLTSLAIALESENPLAELLKTSEEIEEMKRSGELVEWDTPIVKKEKLDNHLTHDDDHRWYWDYNCCKLREKLKTFISQELADQKARAIKIVGESVITTSFLCKSSDEDLIEYRNSIATALEEKL